MKKYRARLHYALIVLLVALLAAANFVAYSFSGIITSALCGNGVSLDKDTMAAVVKESTALAETIAEEGITLLKNENGVLPLKKDADGQIKVNVFGKSSSDKCFVYQGYGSGGGSREESAQVSLYTALRNAGISINEDLASDYNSLSGVRNRSIVGDDKNIYEAPNSFYSDKRMQDAKSYSSTAIVVISRCLGEGYDAMMYQTVNGSTTYDRHYLQLCQEEEYMLEKVTATFDKVIVVLNSTNVMEAGFLDNEKIDAALTVYTPGNNGISALGSILTGAVNPSGHTVDTWTYDFSTAATYANAGVNGTHDIAQGGYIDYAEGIYVDYLWYETADVEGYWAKVDNSYGKGYEGVVQYPFGYGLSYTEFDWTVEVDVPNPLTKDSEITFTVYVANVGDVAGQDVVQLYYTPPYTAGGIEKAAVNLCNFGKTHLLEPGTVESITLTVKISELASYDCYDANNNGFMGYEVEKGEYIFSLRTDAHTVKVLDNEKKANYAYGIGQDYRYENDTTTGYTVTNRFTTYTNTISGACSTYTEASLSDDAYAYSIDGSDADCNIAYMTRADFSNTFPKATTTRTFSSDFVNKSFKMNSPKVNAEDEMPTVGSKTTSWTLDDLIGSDYEDERWEELVSQLTLSEMANLCANGGWGTNQIYSINKPYCSHADGPSGFNRAISSLESGYATNYPCATLIASTWNYQMAYQYGVAMGIEAEAANVQGLYGPACNIHRSPFSGRNFEYYSADGYLSGVMVAYAAKGMNDKGLYCFVKHFAVADSEPQRSGKYTWLTEQALREIYLRPFESAVKVGGTTAVMTAYNRVGSVRASGSYNLLTEVLRNEWGFKGCVISDYYCGNNAMDEDEFIRAGNDLKLFPGGKASDFDDLKSATAIKALQKSSKNILYCYLQTRYIGVTSQGLDLSYVIGTKEAVKATWVPFLVIFDVLAVGACGFWGFTVYKKSKKGD